MTGAISLAIVGTRGIPNNYGGFEQFAQHLAADLASRGHEVLVYNPNFHTFDKDDYCGARIVRKWCPEKFMGAAAHYIYDYLCLRDAIGRGVNIVLECGYTSSGPGLLIVRKRGSAVVLNMDGIEWKRAKWGQVTRALIRFSERAGVARADYLIADNEGIGVYLRNAYDADSTVIPYGTTIAETMDRAPLEHYGVLENGYYLAIARLEPENNIEMILDGFLAADSGKTFCVVGNHETRYGDYLKSKYRDPRIRYLGGIYNLPAANALRHFSALYFHGHSVGGTNPSLLDAMANEALICAHDNVFNRSVLGDDAFYFSTVADVAHCIGNEGTNRECRARFSENNMNKIRTVYSWERIADAYEELFRRILAERGTA